MNYKTSSPEIHLKLVRLFINLPSETWPGRCLDPAGEGPAVGDEDWIMNGGTKWMLYNGTSHSNGFGVLHGTPHFRKPSKYGWSNWRGRCFFVLGLSKDFRSISLKSPVVTKFNLPIIRTYSVPHKKTSQNLLNNGPIKPKMTTACCFSSINRSTIKKSRPGLQSAHRRGRTSSLSKLPHMNPYEPLTIRCYQCNLDNVW